MEKVRFQLPAAEDDLWHQVTIRLLEQRDVDEEQAKNHLRLLEWLAFCRRFCEKPLTGAFVENTAMWLAEDTGIDRATPRKTVQQWLADLEQWELLLRHGSGNDATFEFTVPTLDEYFAARHLAARYAEEDERYQTWLPCSKGWWQRGKTLRCPNPCCQATLLPFCKLLRQAEYEETLLLMVSLLKEAEREERFLDGISDDLNLKLKALSRCRHAHADIVQDALNPVLTGMPSVRDVTDGLAAMGTARVDANLDAILNRYVCALRDEGARWSAVFAIAPVGEAAVKPLIALLEDKDEKVRHAATQALGEIGDAQAVEPLIAALKDQNRWVRKTAAYALGEIGDAQVVEPLIALLKDKYWDVRRAAAHALGRIADARAVSALRALLDDNVFVRETALQTLEEIERRSGSESRTDT